MKRGRSASSSPSSSSPSRAPRQKELGQSAKSPSLSHKVLRLFQGRLPHPADGKLEKLSVEGARLCFVAERVCRTGRAKHAVEAPRVEFHRALVRRECFRRPLLLHEEVSQKFVGGEGWARRDGVLRGRGFKLSGLSQQRDA